MSIPIIGILALLDLVSISCSLRVRPLLRIGLLDVTNARAMEGGRSSSRPCCSPAAAGRQLHAGKQRQGDFRRRERSLHRHDQRRPDHHRVAHGNRCTGDLGSLNPYVTRLTIAPATSARRHDLHRRGRVSAGFVAETCNSGVATAGPIRARVNFTYTRQ